MNVDARFKLFCGIMRVRGIETTDCLYFSFSSLPRRRGNGLSHMTERALVYGRNFQAV